MDFRNELIELIGPLQALARARYARNEHEAEELVQITLLKALDKEDQFDGRSLKAWVRTIMQNSYIDEFTRRRTTDSITPETEPSDIEAHAFSIDVEKCMEELQPDARELVIMKHKGFDYAEISSFCDVSVDALATRLHRAREQLSKCLGMEEKWKGKRR